mgnify:FL=1
MNYQCVEKLSKKFKIENGWEVVYDGDYNVYSNFWKVELEGMSMYDDGCGYPYINLYVRLGSEGYPKYIVSFSRLKDCIDYIKSVGKV